MTDYDIFILGGSFLIIAGVINVLAALSSGRPVMWSLVVSLVGGGMLLYADSVSPSGFAPQDVLTALFKAVGMIFE